MTRRMSLFLMVAACAGKSGGRLDRNEVQSTVATVAQARIGVAPKAVTCPDKVKAAAGASFTCEVTFEGGGTLPFKVDQVDAAGSLAVEPVGDWMRGDQMAADLTTEMFLIGHEEATVDCGGAVVATSVPGAVKCKVTKGAKSADVDVAVDAERDVTWKIVGAL